MFRDPVFAEVCTGKRTNHPDNRRFFQVVKRGAVNDSIGQGGDYASTAGEERKNCFYLQKDFLITVVIKNDGAVYDSAIIQFT
ncbi:hypothetical protein [Escherichia fergusonii]|uniref:hypothetical protein n=1 Tax=Escherichia fergusonii TaxID=564 RepID=UPI00159BEB9B|nr:hypothetical protein [Escherichia fergusonii]